MYKLLVKLLLFFCLGSVSCQGMNRTLNRSTLTRSLMTLAQQRQVQIGLLGLGLYVLSNKGLHSGVFATFPTDKPAGEPREAVVSSNEEEKSSDANERAKIDRLKSEFEEMKAEGAEKVRLARENGGKQGNKEGYWIGVGRAWGISPACAEKVYLRALQAVRLCGSGCMAYALYSGLRSSSLNP